MASAHPISPTFLARTLEGIFEDAKFSGNLKLGNRKLKEYPNIVDESELVDTTEIDISRNRFTEVPKEISHYESLEKISCYSNYIRYLPSTFANLHCLTYLNISRNQLTHLPAFTGELVSLEVLLVSHNKLLSLPEEMQHLRNLQDLDVSFNELSSIPPHLGQLRQLKRLNVKMNKLLELPPELSNINLHHFDCSGNKIQVLPLEFRCLDSLHTICLQDNPLTQPPAQLCTKGLVHIRKYLYIQSLRETKKLGAMGENSPFRSRDGRRSLRNEGDSKSQNRRHTVELQKQKADLELKKRRAEQLKHEDKSKFERKSTSESLTSEEVGETSTEGEGVPSGVGINSLDSSPDRLGHNGHSSTPDGQANSRLHPSKNEDSRAAPSGMTALGVSRGGSSSSLKAASSLHSSSSALKQQQLAKGRSPAGGTSTAALSRKASESPGPTRQEMARSNGSRIASAPGYQPTGPSATSPGLRVVGPGSSDPKFTMRRERDQIQEDIRAVQTIKAAIESRLKITLGDKVQSALKNGVILCHLVNHVRPRSVSQVHIPSAAVPKLSVAKCRRNVENFLEACKTIGVPTDQMCVSADILEEKRVTAVARTVGYLHESGSAQRKVVKKKVAGTTNQSTVV